MNSALAILTSISIVCAIVLGITLINLNGRIEDQRVSSVETLERLDAVTAQRDTLADVTDGLLAREDSLDRAFYIADSLSARLEATEIATGFLGYYLLIDTHQNRFHLRRKLGTGQDVLVRSGYCGTGKGWTFNDAGRAWDFSTPRGVRYILGNGENPYWYRPEWYWQEMGLTPPTPDEIVVIPDTLSWDDQIVYYNDSLTASERIWVKAVPGALGSYKLDLGGGLLLHYGVGRGRNVSHGCIRLSSTDLEALYRALPVGAPVIIY